ncbi:MAG: glycogen/starch synthase [Bacteroidaceae bacterium]|nr:glycogen/starch synthase [Bacteroidaceae bacterium]MBR5149522.1 glycogen/starch synthase [Bacteroidaceae bacterium]
MSVNKTTPDYIFEISWEVCNKVGGIYTVLSTRAKTILTKTNAQLVFIGPDLWKETENPLFKEDKRLLAGWRKKATEEGLAIRIGRWNIPGEPVAVLVDFTPYYNIKNEIYSEAWNLFSVDSLHAYGDYDEASMFSYAAARVAESYYKHIIAKDIKKGNNPKVIYQAHEWMTGLGALFLKHWIPSIATIFTTHATSIGRSIAGNMKPLYDYMSGYNGDQMASELNMESKHSIEKQSAHRVDCFTTVSEITDVECTQLLEKPADVILVNGFEDDFVPKGAAFTAKRKEARKVMLNVAGKLLGQEFSDDTIIVSTGGRYEFRNKGIDILLESLKRLADEPSLDRDVLAFINVPAWVKGPREDLAPLLSPQGGKNPATVAELLPLGGGWEGAAPLDTPVITHELYNMNDDKALSMMRAIGLDNNPNSRVKVIFVPCYLNGNDGIFNMPYYDLLPGDDLAVYPSYYEPWGYTPLESVAFHVPTITTDLAGFGLWANSLKGEYSQLEDGVKVVHRTDSNWNEAADEIKNTILAFTKMDDKLVADLRRRAAAIAKKALWDKFVKYYLEAYEIALSKI